MSAGKIIEKIKYDTEIEVEKIIKDAERQSKQISNNSREEAKKESETIISNGKKHNEIIKKILISKANQDAKREITRIKEKIIEECFKRANSQLSELNDEKYKKIAKRLMKDGMKKLSNECTVIISKNIDKEIAKQLGLKVTGRINTTGGIILESIDGKITLNNTFDGILKREKDKIRIKVGRLLFS